MKHAFKLTNNQRDANKKKQEYRLSAQQTDKEQERVTIPRLVKMSGEAGTLSEGRLKTDTIFLQGNLAKHKKALSSQELEANSPLVKIHPPELPRQVGKDVFTRIFIKGKNQTIHQTSSNGAG